MPAACLEAASQAAAVQLAVHLAAETCLMGVLGGVWRWMCSAVWFGRVLMTVLIVLVGLMRDEACWLFVLWADP